jgi:protein-tyrosine kinase
MDIKKLPTSHPAALPVDSEQITYTQTRIVKTDNQRLRENRIITGFKPGKWRESFKMLRTRCLQSMGAMKWKTLAVTSPNGNAGSSLTAANLAISIAMELNRSVLLVDANFQNPNISKLFGIQADAGLSDHLLHGTPLNEVLVNPSIDRLVILPAGKDLLDSTEILRSPKMIRLVNEMKTRYASSRVVIFDLPPLLSQADTLGFAPYVDCLLLVVEEGQTKTDELEQAGTLLKEINLLGTVLNKTTDYKIKYSEA